MPGSVAAKICHEHVSGHAHAFSPIKSIHVKGQNHPFVHLFTLDLLHYPGGYSNKTPCSTQSTGRAWRSKRAAENKQKAEKEKERKNIVDMDASH